ncbi:MAG: hypothetical protein J2P26_03175, partial [Nocardiopsaceae bacterium]|nr:hypothetical protein [Nocardiopsaceae bacterium]
MAKHLSGTMRFSVESLLYYAPKIVQTGDTLAASVTTVRRQLLDLGDFVGTSWMEESFRAHYLPAEQAMLVSAAGLAYEIQAIGAGIEQMARTYGITEQQNSADVNRIRQNQDQYPADKLPQPLPARHEEPPPQPLVPTPRPGKSPHPVAPSPSPSMSGPTATPTPHTGTPMPRPGLAPTDHYTTDGGRTILGPWWPNTNTTRMEDAAHAWTLLTGALDNAWTDLSRYTAYIMADTQGPAADAFNEYVDGLTARGHGSLTQAVQVSEDLHDFCLAQVREVVNTRSMILQTVIDLGLQIALDQALAAVSDGAGEVLTSGAIARFITRAVDILKELLSFGGRGAEVLEDAGKLFGKAVGSKAGKIGTKALAGGGKGALIGVANTFINNE